MRYEGSHRTIQPDTREPNVTGHDIKTDKRNARIFCRFGAYLAMLKVITDNVLVEREVFISKQLSALNFIYLE
ncbi:unnamed protein product [Meloidogyne enterolobii]|uniref:Uncharacterized protein n=1 Tax=Meloidogyne enterolobii TaxID=390850 RepID=A0ACB1ADL8_MELEN